MTSLTCPCTGKSPVPSPRERPIPAGGRPKPNLAAAKPRATALYDYSPNDTDEIGFAQGEVVEVLREGERKKEKKGIQTESMNCRCSTIPSNPRLYVTGR
jgi:hypothetical protein